MKLSPVETTLLRLLKNNGGSMHLDADDSVAVDRRRLLKRMERNGIVFAEPTDAGTRFDLTEIGWAEAVNAS